MYIQKGTVLGHIYKNKTVWLPALLMKLCMIKYVNTNNYEIYIQHENTIQYVQYIFITQLISNTI